MNSDKLIRFLNNNSFTKTLQSQVKRYENERNEVHKMKVELRKILQETKEERTKNPGTEN